MALKARIKSKFPASVLGTTGVAVARSGGVYTFSFGFTNLTVAADLGALNLANVYLPVYDSDNTNYRRISVDNIVDEISGAVSSPILTDISALSTTGLIARVGSGDVDVRTITGTSAEITVADGNGVSGNPTLSLPAALTFTGKTITGGTFSGPILTGISSFAISDAGFTITDNGDATKIIAFEASGITTGTTRTLTAPNASGTIALTSDQWAIATAISGLGANVATFLATPSSANLLAAVTDETGSGSLVFGTAPTIAGGTHTGLTTLGIRDTSAAFDVTLAAVSSTPLTTGRTLTLDMLNAGRTVRLAGNIDIAGTLTTLGALTLPAVVQGDLFFGGGAATVQALAKSTSTTRYISNTGTDNNPAWAQVDLTNGVTGDLPFSNVAQIATSRILGRTTASTGDIEALTGAQAGGLINLGDLADVSTATPTKGNVLVADGTNWIQIGVGTNAHVLTADSAQALGVKWAAAPGAGGGLADAYQQFTDGTTVTAASAGDTFKFRVGTGITAVTQSNDATHGDNLLISLDAELVALAGLTSAADKGIQFTGAGTAGVYDLTAAGKALLDDADAAAQRTTLGLAAVAASGSASDLSTGTLPSARLSSADTPYGRQCIPIPAGAMTSRTTNGAAAGSVEMTTNKNMFITKDFDTTTAEYVQFCVPMPASWDEGTVTFAPVWSHASTTVNFGAIFTLAGVAISNDDPGDVAFGTAQSSSDTGGTTNDIYEGPESSAITIAGTPQAGDFVMFQLARDISDTLGIDARLHGIKLFITTNAGHD